MRRAQGFSMVELIVVMVLIGIVAAVGVPKLMSDNSTAASAFGNQVVSALRYATKSAVAHRRLVCATVAASEVKLQIASNPDATACNVALPALSSDPYSTSDSDIRAGGLLGTLYFQPDGTITSDGAGDAAVRGNITITAQGKVLRTIKVEGSTGYVN
jgi:MSHA pilin protein MshC